MGERGAAAAVLGLAACIVCTVAAPVNEQTALDVYDPSTAKDGCYYNFRHYAEGDRIMTNEPCLNCTCHNRMLMCYLRVCPFTKPIGQDCTVEKRADQCCPIITCPDVPVDLLTSTSTTSPAEYGSSDVGRLDKYGCTMNGKFYSEGSKLPSVPGKPCELCYCIRNMTTCVMQECTLHIDGCTPIYHKNACCPVRYSCDHPENEMPLLDDMTTTVRPTPGFLLTTTSATTAISQDCVHENEVFADGALIKTEKACEHCYCMKGDIVCVVQECGTPMENEGKNCTSLPPREGQCCPDTYICENDIEEGSGEQTEIPQRLPSEGSGYRGEDGFEGTTLTAIEPEIEGSGFADTLSSIMPTIFSATTDENTEEQEQTTEQKPISETTKMPEVSVKQTVSDYTTQSTDKLTIPAEPVTDATISQLDTRIDDSEQKPPTPEHEIPIEKSTSPTSSIETSTLQSKLTETPEKINEVDVTKSDESTTKATEDYESSTTTKEDENNQMDERPSSESDQELPQSTPNPTVISPAATQPDKESNEPESSSDSTVNDIDELTENPNQEPITEIELLTEKVQTMRPGSVEEPTQSTLSDKYVPGSTETPEKITTFTPHETVSTINEEQPTVIHPSMAPSQEEKESTTIAISPTGSEPYSTILDEKPTSSLSNDKLTTLSDHSISDEELTPIVSTESTPQRTESATVAPENVETTPIQLSEVTEKELPEVTTIEILRQPDDKKRQPTLIPEENIPTTISPEDVIEPLTETTKVPSEKPLDESSPAFADTSVSVTLQDKTQESTEPSESTSKYEPSELTDTFLTTSMKPDMLATEIVTAPTKIDKSEKPDIYKSTTYSPQEGITDDSKLSPITESSIMDEEVSKMTTTIVNELITTESEKERTPEEEDNTHLPSQIPFSSTPSIIEKETEIPDTKPQSFESSTSLPDEHLSTTASSMEDIDKNTLSTDKSPSTATTLHEDLSENEISEDDIQVPPIISPGIIPGEGDCLVEGKTYTNDSIVPSTNKCQNKCKCVSSIVKCEPVKCEGPPQNMVNCEPLYESPDSCCPNYACDISKETIPPESHNLMAETGSTPLPSVEEDLKTSTFTPVSEPEIVPVSVPALCTSGSCAQIPDDYPVQLADDKTDDSVPATSLPILPDSSCTGNSCQLPTKSDDAVKPNEVVEVSVVPVSIEPSCSGSSCALEPTETKEPIGLPNVPVTVDSCSGPECSQYETTPQTIEKEPETVKPETSLTPEGPDKPEETVEPTEPVRFEEPLKPEESEKPEDPGYQEETVKPEGSTESPEPDKSKETLKPEVSTEPGEPLKQEAPEKPESSVTPEATFKPEESVKPEETTKPTEAEKPEIPLKPDDSIEPGEDDMLVVTEKSQEPEKQEDAEKPKEPVTTDESQPGKPEKPEIYSEVSTVPIDTECTDASCEFGTSKPETVHDTDKPIRPESTEVSCTGSSCLTDTRISEGPEKPDESYGTTSAPETVDISCSDNSCLPVGVETESAIEVQTTEKPDKATEVLVVPVLPDVSCTGDSCLTETDKPLDVEKTEKPSLATATDTSCTGDLCASEPEKPDDMEITEKPSLATATDTSCTGDLCASEPEKPDDMEKTEKPSLATAIDSSCTDGSCGDENGKPQDTKGPQQPIDVPITVDASCTDSSCTYENIQPEVTEKPEDHTEVQVSIEPSCTDSSCTLASDKPLETNKPDTRVDIPVTPVTIDSSCSGTECIPSIVSDVTSHECLTEECSKQTTEKSEIPKQPSEIDETQTDSSSLLGETQATKKPETDCEGAECDVINENQTDIPEKETLRPTVNTSDTVEPETTVQDNFLAVTTEKAVDKCTGADCVEAECENGECPTVTEENQVHCIGDECQLIDTTHVIDTDKCEGGSCEETRPSTDSSKVTPQSECENGLCDETSQNAGTKLPAPCESDECKGSVAEVTDRIIDSHCQGADCESTNAPASLDGKEPVTVATPEECQGLECGQQVLPPHQQIDTSEHLCDSEDCVKSSTPRSDSIQSSSTGCSNSDCENEIPVSIDSSTPAKVECTGASCESSSSDCGMDECKELAPVVTDQPPIDQQKVCTDENCDDSSGTAATLLPDSKRKTTAYEQTTEHYNDATTKVSEPEENVAMSTQQDYTDTTKQPFVDTESENEKTTKLPLVSPETTYSSTTDNKEDEKQKTDVTHAIESVTEPLSQGTISDETSLYTKEKEETSTQEYIVMLEEHTHKPEVVTLAPAEVSEPSSSSVEEMYTTVKQTEEEQTTETDNLLVTVGDQTPDTEDNEIPTITQVPAMSHISDEDKQPKPQGRPTVTPIDITTQTEELTHLSTTMISQEATTPSQIIISTESEKPQTDQVKVTPITLVSGGFTTQTTNEPKESVTDKSTESSETSSTEQAESHITESSNEIEPTKSTQESTESVEPQTDNVKVTSVTMVSVGSTTQTPDEPKDSVTEKSSESSETSSTERDETYQTESPNEIEPTKSPQSIEDHEGTETPSPTYEHMTTLEDTNPTNVAIENEVDEIHTTPDNIDHQNTFSSETVVLSTTQPSTYKETPIDTTVPSILSISSTSPETSSETDAQTVEVSSEAASHASTIPEDHILATNVPDELIGGTSVSPKDEYDTTAAEDSVPTTLENVETTEPQSISVDHIPTDASIVTPTTADLNIDASQQPSDDNLAETTEGDKNIRHPVEPQIATTPESLATTVPSVQDSSASTSKSTPEDKFQPTTAVPLETTKTREETTPTTSSSTPSALPSPDEDVDHQAQEPSGGYGGSDYEDDNEEQAFGPGTCRYGGKVYVSAQQIPRDDPCDFCFCFRSDIICLQQSCPPPIHGCHEEPIEGFCCPRYECPVSMGTSVNVTTTTTTTTTTLPPHFFPHAYKGSAQKRGCQIKGHSYQVGEVVRASSGPCLHCTCGGDGQMKCDPKVCTPEPMLRQMIAAAVSTRRRR